ncbi:restriction endonuclease subunit S [uncultured Ornithinimicrobium sp.]|uniref:restriction endonuclease subunit S n=1 Tax=uncultured Ornithinimicrobium sp. TaxID=259307 RepID=UPI0025972D7B|nr:restriction endonuclease subunit S [uncultured Ornithinimicrobium sp.]
MRDGWETVPLGQVTTQVIDPIPIAHDKTYSNLGLRMYAGGVFEREAKSGAQIKASRLFRVRSGQFIYNRLFAGGGSFGLVRPEHEHGVVSNEFPVFDLDPNRLLPEYLYLHFQQPSTWETVAEQCIGTTQTRLRWKEDRFRAYPVALPPLDEQRRIVDLIGALDDTIATLSDGIDKAGSARGFLLQGLLHRLSSDTPSLPLGELGEFTRGRRFTKADYVEEAGLGCIHYGQVHTHFGSVATETLTFIPETMKPRMRLASPGDVVVAATSENAEDLGKATVWMGNDEIAVHDDCQIFRHRLDPRFASHLFATEAFNRQKLQYAAGTKVTRISGDNLARITVPVPDSTDQQRIGQTMSDLDDTLSAMRGSRSRLRSLRSNLLTALLSGEHEIPESYDEVMEATA